jgi:hypothetical protein
MNIQEAKNIVLADYLQSLGIVPCKKQGATIWYYSPFREESEPSFKVNPARNEWYDFGLGRGGSILDFVMERNGTDSVSHALQSIAGKIADIPHRSFSFRKQEYLPAFEDIDVQPLSNPALLQYLNERNIHIPFAEQFCREIHFTTNGKHYFAISFENDLGGYELRNKYFQGCLSPKTITGIRNGNDTCCVFEGFMDYLSYLTLKEKSQPNNMTKHDYVILNSVTNLPKALDIIENYTTAYCFLDNDHAGTKAWFAISDRCGLKVSDQSVHYRQYKDLNDYLCGKKMEQTPLKKRGMKL